MRQGKEISSVKNSIQTRLSGVMLLVLVFALGINVFIFKQIHTAVTRIDAVFSSNTAVNELSESLEQVESRFMNIKYQEHTGSGKIIIVMNRITRI